MYTALRVLLLIFISLPAIAGATNRDYDSLRAEQRDGRWYVVHQVEQQETLFSLSRRYGAAVGDIRVANDMDGNAIDIDQVIYIPVEQESVTNALVSTDSPEVSATNMESTHKVQPKETLFSISRQYDVTVEQLREWNDLGDNSLDIGQQLIVSSQGKRTDNTSPSDRLPKIITPITPVGSGSTSEVPDLEKRTGDEDFAEVVAPDLRPRYVHYVQAGETLRSIARKFKTETDSLMTWNELGSDRLTIGQKILIRKEVQRTELVHRTSDFKKTKYGSKLWVEQDSGRVLVREEGIAGVIDGDVGTTRYLALHRDLPVGSEMKVLNLMNHREIRVKVVGKLPETGLNRKVMVRLTSVSFKELGIIDPKSRVELSYVNLN